MLKIYNHDGNIPRGIHYYFRNFSDFLETMGEPYMEIDLNNYRINAGTIEIKTGQEEIDVDNILYVIDDRVNYHRCYHVTGSVIQSGYLILSISIDYWGSFLERALFSKINVIKSNKNVGIGLFDPIPVTKDMGSGFVSNYLKLTESNIAIVFSVAFSTGVSSILGNGAGTAIGCYYMGIDRAQIPAGSSYTSKLEYAVALISGIYGVVQNGAVRDANVLNAYIVPEDLFTGRGSGYEPTFRTKPAYTDVTFDIQNVPVLAIGDKNKFFNLTISPNYEYYVGTLHAALKLKRTTQSAIQIDYTAIARQDGIQILVRQGAEMLDITDAFSVGLTSNDGNFTTSQQISRGIQAISGFTGGVIQLASGTGAVSGGAQIVSAINSVVQEGNARYSKGGDGVNTFKYIGIENAKQTYRSPFMYTVHTSIADENENVKERGATFNQHIQFIGDIFDYDFISSDANQIAYAVIDCNVSNVPQNAARSIENELRNGLSLVDIRS